MCRCEIGRCYGRTVIRHLSDTLQPLRRPTSVRRQSHTAQRSLRHSRAHGSHVVAYPYANGSNILCNIYIRTHSSPHHGVSVPMFYACWNGSVSLTSNNLTQHARLYARSNDSGAANFGQVGFEPEDADPNESLEHLNIEHMEFSAHVSTR